MMTLNATENLNKTNNTTQDTQRNNYLHTYTFHVWHTRNYRRTYMVPTFGAPMLLAPPWCAPAPSWYVAGAPWYTLPLQENNHHKISYSDKQLAVFESPRQSVSQKHSQFVTKLTQINYSCDKNTIFYLSVGFQLSRPSGEADRMLVTLNGAPTVKLPIVSVCWE